MNNRSRFFGVRWAVSGLMLAAAFECLANPVLIGEGEQVLAASQGEHPLPDVVPYSDGRPVERDALPVAIDEIRFDDGVPGRRPGFGDALRTQLLHDFGNRSVNAAGAPAMGMERARRGTESDPGGSSSLNPAEAMLREAAENALKLIRDFVIDESEMVNFSVAGVDFNLTLSGGRHSLTVNGTEVWPTILYDPVNEELRQGPSMMGPGAMQGIGGQSSGGGGGGGFAQSWASAQSSPLQSNIPGSATDGAPLIYSRIRELVTDPMTIIVAFGGLFVWMAYEIASAVRDRRRLRRYRRHEARARI